MDVVESILNPESELTIVKVSIQKDYQLKAILLNESDFGYGIFTLDSNSLSYFENNLSKIKNKLTKQVLII